MSFRVFIDNVSYFAAKRLCVFIIDLKRSESDDIEIGDRLKVVFEGEEHIFEIEDIELFQGTKESGGLLLKIPFETFPTQQKWSQMNHVEALLLSSRSTLSTAT